MSRPLLDAIATCFVIDLETAAPVPSVAQLPASSAVGVLGPYSFRMSKTAIGVLATGIGYPVGRIRVPRGTNFTGGRWPTMIDSGRSDDDNHSDPALPLRSIDTAPVDRAVFGDPQQFCSPSRPHHRQWLQGDDGVRSLRNLDWLCTAAAPTTLSTKQELIDMRTLVTGAAGFIGSTLVDRLLSEGHQVVGVDNLTTGIAANLAHARMCNERHLKRFTFVRADIQAPELADIVAGTNPDLVFHLAAQVDLRTSVTDPLGDARSNVLGTINLLEACRRARAQRIIYAASGSSRYGAPVSLPASEDTPVEPLSPNAAAKLAAELYLCAYAEMCGISPISLALGSVYGPRQNPHGDSGVVAIFGGALLAGRPVTIYGDGTAVRDYVYIDDVVDALMFAGHLPLEVMGTYNIGTGEQTTVSDVYRLVAEAVGVSSPPRYAAVRTGEVHAIALDSKEAREELGWNPSINLVEGIQRTIQWLRGSLRSVPAALVDA